MFPCFRHQKASPLAKRRHHSTVEEVKLLPSARQNSQFRNHLQKYCYFRNMVVSAVRSPKHSFLMSMTSLIRTPKQFWSGYHSLMPNHEGIPHTLTNGIITVGSLTAKANLLNSCFCRCFTIPSSHTSTPTLSTPLCSHPDLIINHRMHTGRS